nr:hypothetical protein [uncultured Acetatifactor sp.]
MRQMDYAAVMQFMREPSVHATLRDTTTEDRLQARDFILKLYQET